MKITALRFCGYVTAQYTSILVLNMVDAKVYHAETWLVSKRTVRLILKRTKTERWRDF